MQNYEIKGSLFSMYSMFGLALWEGGNTWVVRGLDYVAVC